MIRIAASVVVLMMAVGGAQAADFVVLSEPSAPIDTSFVGSPIYVQLLGGVTFGLDATFYRGDVLDVPDPTKVGFAFAGTVGVTIYDGFSIEADVMRTQRDEVADGNDRYGTTSLMGNVKYTAHLNDSFSLYAGAGLGYIWADNYEGDLDTTFDLDGFGYQLIAGAGFNVTDNIAVIAEYRYQDTFDRYPIGNGFASLDLPTSTILAGVKIGF